MTSIDITKLKRNTRLLVETKDTVFEIKVVGPKSRGVLVHGGIRFVRETKASIEGKITRGKGMTFVCDGDSRFLSSRVLSATVYASDGSWHYDAIEKADFEK